MTGELQMLTLIDEFTRESLATVVQPQPTARLLFLWRFQTLAPLRAGGDQAGAFARCFENFRTREQGLFSLP
jgi:hypothetical protein